MSAKKKSVSLWEVWNTPIRQSQEEPKQVEKIDWIEYMLPYLKAYAKPRKNNYHGWSSDEFIAYSIKKGLKQPPSQNMWGGLFTTAARKRIIFNSGLSVPSSRPNARSRRISVWN